VIKTEPDKVAKKMPIDKVARDLSITDPRIKIEISKLPSFKGKVKRNLSPRY